jgi:hypothetical protein
MQTLVALTETSSTELSTLETEIETQEAGVNQIINALYDVNEAELRLIQNQ